MVLDLCGSLSLIKAKTRGVEDRTASIPKSVSLAGYKLRELRRKVACPPKFLS